ncbi:uncharacterized protein LOC116024306 [Ipomoea triloba]|uniref:uncharacterized protein LOC116024306 n=1 Tax=Ipomoea triloba TaxID=35885 RepID=UPI00125E99C5|nr:uncharacterized protein LOC116024306 [Ipomoea triloba]
MGSLYCLMVDKELEVSVVDHRELNDFANWITDIDDGLVGAQDDGEANVNIPSQHVLGFDGDPIIAIVDSTLPLFCERQHDGAYLTGRAILAPTLDVVDDVNEYMSSMNDAIGCTYLSCGSVCPTESIPNVVAGLHTLELLKGFKCSSLPNHCLSLKVECPIMLLRNIDPSIGLCNRARLIVLKLADHVIEAQILFGTHVGNKVLIPCLSLTPSDMKFPFKFVKGPGFRKFIVVACPMFKIPSRRTISRDISLIYEEERLKWKLSKKNISFVPVASHKGEYIAKALETCLLNWGIRNVREAVRYVRNSPARLKKFKDLSS